MEWRIFSHRTIIGRPYSSVPPQEGISKRLPPSTCFSSYLSKLIRCQPEKKACIHRGLTLALWTCPRTPLVSFGGGLTAGALLMNI